MSAPDGCPECGGLLVSAGPEHWACMSCDATSSTWEVRRLIRDRDALLAAAEAVLFLWDKMDSPRLAMRSPLVTEYHGRMKALRAAVAAARGER